MVLRGVIRTESKACTSSEFPSAVVLDDTDDNGGVSSCWVRLMSPLSREWCQSSSVVVVGVPMVAEKVPGEEDGKDGPPDDDDM